MVFKVKIIDINILKMRTGEGEENVVKICYQFGVDFTRCIFIREDAYTPENVKEVIRKDLAAQLLKPVPEIEIT